MTTRDYNKAVNDYSGGLFRFALKLVQDKALAQDVVQECYLRLWENSSKIDSSKAKSWLYTTGYRESLVVISKSKKKVNGFPEFTGRENSEPDLKEVIEKCLSRLPEIQRSILMLRDYEGYGYREIGEILGLRESQVKVYLFRARGKMKEIIKDLNLVI